MKELLKVLNEIANEFDCEVEIDNEFAYYYEENLIVVNPLDTDDTFLKFARTLGLDEEVSAFTVCYKMAETEMGIARETEIRRDRQTEKQEQKRLRQYRK